MTRSKSQYTRPKPPPTERAEDNSEDKVLDPGQIDALLQQTIAPALSPQDNHNPLLETLVEQVQQLAERVTAIEAAQAAFVSQIEHLESQVHKDMRAAIIEVGAMRNELIGERKVLSALSVFNGVVQMLDTLRAIQNTLDTSTDSPVPRQVESMIDSLIMMLRGLGFIEFHVTVGDLFDPTSMEVTGYAQGEPGVVLSQTRSGFRAPTGIVRHAGVQIANPYTV